MNKLSRRKKTNSIFKLIMRFLKDYAISIMVGACLGVMIFTTITFDDSKTVYKASQYEIHAVYGEEYRLAYNIERIKIFGYADLWDEATHEEKQDAVVALAECEARYKGIPFKIKIVFRDDMEYTSKGYYIHENHTIYINDEALSSSSGVDAMLNVLHELRHVYQFSLADIYAKMSKEERNLICFEGIDEWIKNINNYVEKPYEVYRNQILEIDARDSAQNEARVYLREIYDLCEDE